MNYQERLKAIIDHDIIVNVLHDAHDEEGAPGVPPGRLREIGDDYLVIETKAEAEGGFANEGGEWFVSIQYVTTIIHMASECTGCLANITKSKN